MIIIMDKTVVTISSIRPDFIRMSEIFKKLDANFNHILVHTGQHYDELLSSVFFQELNIRPPDYILNCGKESKNHYEQLSYLSVEVIKLFERENIKPDLIMLLGDSNSVLVSVPLRKEGYKIAHIEAGMRSGDKRMLEEINRTVCDHCSDILFVYHEDYKMNLARENITNNVFVVGNTITEVCKTFIPTEPKRNELILLDIHRPENFKYKNRLENIIKYANLCGIRYGLEVHMLRFHGTMKHIEQFNINLGNIIVVDLMPYKKYLTTIYHCLFCISDSGTSQEEIAFFNTKTVTVRDFSERPRSYSTDCSYQVDINTASNSTWNGSYEWIDKPKDSFDTSWLGDGTTSDMVIDILKNKFFV